MSSLRGRPAQHLPPRNHATFETTCKTGRVAHYAIDIGCAQPLYVFNVYAWPCADQSVAVSKRNESLFAAIFRHIELTKPYLYAIVGDFNCTIMRNPVLASTAERPYC